MKQILIINGHPDKQSFCRALAENYQTGTIKAGATSELIHLSDIKFNPVLQYSYRQRTELEPELKDIQHKIKNADHLVFIYPIWWGTFPALLKGFIDRVFLPGFAFSYRENSPFWDKLLKGKSARIITTMDAPCWYYQLITKSPGHHAMKKATLQFCGINPVKITSFQQVKKTSQKQRKKWLLQVYQLGFHQK